MSRNRRLTLGAGLFFLGALLLVPPSLPGTSDALHLLLIPGLFLLVVGALVLGVSGPGRTV